MSLKITEQQRCKRCRRQEKCNNAIPRPHSAILRQGMCRRWNGDGQYENVET